jgi:hypothetical protein
MWSKVHPIYTESSFSNTDKHQIKDYWVKRTKVSGLLNNYIVYYLSTKQFDFMSENLEIVKWISQFKTMFVLYD